MRSQEDISPVNQPVPDADPYFDAPASEEDRGIDIAAALWRYKWAVIIPALVGLCVGLVAYTQLPEVYEASSRLLVESDQPMILDSTTGEAVSGVPGSDLIESQLFSDQVLRNAQQDERMKPYLAMVDEEFDGSFGKMAEEVIVFEPETDEKVSKNSLAFKLAIHHTDPDFCEAAILSFNKSLQDYFASRRKDSLGELRRLIEMAKDKLHPELKKLEADYRQFRQTVSLQSDAQGVAFNPYREEQLRLMQQASELQEKKRQAAVQLNILETVVQGAKDPLTAIETIAQLLDKQLILPNDRRRRMHGMSEEDSELAVMTMEERLVPLIVEREQYAAQFGTGHPSVKQLDKQIEVTRKQLSELVQKQAERMTELLQGSEADKRQAQEAVVAVLSAMRAENEMLKEQIDGLQEQINVQKELADELAEAEQENQSRLREIERAQQLFAQLDEQMARVQLTDKQAGIELTQLSAPSKAKIVGPSLLKLLAGGMMAGLMLGCGLAYLLEGQAGTFRSAEEISNTLHLPILTHVPFDAGKRPRKKKGEEDPYENLDDKLSVLHRPASMPAEAVRAGRTAIFFESASNGARVIQVTSPLPGDGKSTMAGNLAISMAQAGKRVLMIDCDLRRPQLSDNFDVGSGEGLTNVLNGDCDPDSAIHETPVKNLFVMPSGPIPVNPAEALTLPEMGELLGWLRERYDYVIVDTPPLLVVTDPSILASLVDTVVLTVKVRRKSKANAKEAVGILRGVGARIAGVIINASDEAAGSDGYKGYGYYKYSRYASKYYGSTSYTNRNGGKSNKKFGGGRARVLVAGRSNSGPIAGEGPGKVNGVKHSQLNGSATAVLDPPEEE